MTEQESGNRDFPLWLIGDSNPSSWQSEPALPLDPRRRTRHSIWTPILDVIQDRVYRSAGLRLDTTAVYVRNALQDKASKPLQMNREWGPAVDEAVLNLRKLIDQHRPVMLFCFGAFAFEFARRAVGERETHNWGYWGARRLGAEFRERVTNFEPGGVNTFPLLHRVISGSKYMESHEHFCGQKGADYYELVGSALAETMLQYRLPLPIWIDLEGLRQSANAGVA